MKKIIYCIKCNNNRKLKNSKVSYIFYKTLVFSIICDKCSNKDQTIYLKKKKLVEILKSVVLINYVEEY